MMLLLPEAALLIVVIPGIIQVRLVLPLQVPPDLVAGLRVKRRIVVNDILELVDHRPVRDKAAAVLKVHVHIVLRARSEEQIHPGLGEEFHRHGVRFSRLHRDIRMLSDRIIGDNPALEGMSALMRDDIRIPGGSVEVCEDEWSLVVRQVRHVASCLLCPAPDYVKQMIVAHEVHELSGLR